MIISWLNKTKESNGSSRDISAEARQLAHPSCLAPPRRVPDPNVNGWLNFAKK